MTDDQFLRAVRTELKRARRLFPGENATTAALVEEVGEVAKAMMWEPFDAVRAEAVQVAVMACRLATEGDATMAAWREEKVHYNGTRYCLRVHRMPTAKGGAK